MQTSYQSSEVSRPLGKSLTAFATIAIFTVGYVTLFYDKTSFSIITQKVAVTHDGSMAGNEPKSLVYDDGVPILPYAPSSNSSHKGIFNYFSPYEQRFPNYKLTYGFQKTIPYNNHIPTDKQICFVHVGKAGGSTIGCR